MSAAFYVAGLLASVGAFRAGLFVYDTFVERRECERSARTRDAMRNAMAAETAKR